MHSYATNAPERNTARAYLAVAAVVLGAGVDALLRSRSVTLPWIVGAPSLLSLYGLLFWVFDRWAWRWRFRGLRLSAIPDLHGRWHGQIKSSHQGTSVQAVLEVEQTWSRIAITLTTEQSRSKSTMATLNTKDSFEQGLKYEYMNEPKVLGIETLHIHRGTAHLRFSNDGRVLEGDYYTGRPRHNYGELWFERQPLGVAADKDTISPLAGEGSAS